LSSGHGYGAGLISIALSLVLEAGVSLRAAPRVLTTVSRALGLSLAVPCWTTVRLWLLRMGHAVLRTQPVEAVDWAWLIDHSVQIGPEKCLVILGIRLIDLPRRGESLRQENLQLIELLPARSWTRPQVDQAMENCVLRSGIVPRVIVSDHGVDLYGGISLFQQRHPQTAEIYDAKHKAACLLKKRLEKNARWRAFQTRVGQTRCSVQQTELAFVTPPGPRPKSRFMNLGPQLKWARRVQAMLREPACVQQFATRARLEKKLGWLAGFEADVIEWSQWQQVVDAAVATVNSQGIHCGTASLMEKQLSQLDALGSSATGLAGELVQFVQSQQAQVRGDERFPGSTEVLESCFGKFKQLERQHCKGGFTQLLLGFGAILRRATTEAVREGLQASNTAAVRQWAAQTLGTTLFARRKLAYACATKDG
jgi:hypothetical protein